MKHPNQRHPTSSVVWTFDEAHDILNIIFLTFQLLTQKTLLNFVGFTRPTWIEPVESISKLAYNQTCFSTKTSPTTRSKMYDSNRFIQKEGNSSGLCTPVLCRRNRSISTHI